MSFTSGGGIPRPNSWARDLAVASRRAPPRFQVDPLVFWPSPQHGAASTSQADERLTVERTAENLTADNHGAGKRKA